MSTASIEMESAMNKSGRVLNRENAERLDEAFALLTKCKSKLKAFKAARETVQRYVAAAMVHARRASSADSPASYRRAYASRCLKALVAADAANLSARDLHDECDEHFAAAVGHIKAVRESGRDDVYDPDSELAFEAAQRKRQIEVLALALSNSLH